MRVRTVPPDTAQVRSITKFELLLPPSYHRDVICHGAVVSKAELYLLILDNQVQVDDERCPLRTIFFFQLAVVPIVLLRSGIHPQHGVEVRASVVSFAWTILWWSLTSFYMLVSEDIFSSVRIQWRLGGFLHRFKACLGFVVHFIRCTVIFGMIAGFVTDLAVINYVKKITPYCHKIVNWPFSFLCPVFDLIVGTSCFIQGYDCNKYTHFTERMLKVLFNMLLDGLDALILIS